MSVSPKLLKELGVVLGEEYQVQVSGSDLEVIGNSLVQYFELLSQGIDKNEKEYNSTKKNKADKS